MTRPVVEYDEEADVLYVRLQPGAKVSRTRSLGELRLIDLSDDGAVVGVEFIDASGGVDLRDMPFASRIGDALGDSGLGLPIFA